MPNSRRAFLAPLLAASFACSSVVDKSNPYDPGTPVTAQAKASVHGRLSSKSLPAPIRVDVALVLNNQPYAHQTTLDDGSFAFSEVTPGRYALVASPDGFVPLSLPVSLDPGAQVDLGEVALTLQTGEQLATIKGFAGLANAADASGIQVRIDTLGLSATTDAAGAFQLSVGAGTWKLSFAHSDYKPATVESVAVTPGAKVALPDRVVLAFDPAQVRGAVEGELTAGGFAPLDGASVSLDLTGITGRSGSGSSTPDGLFALGLIPAGSYVLRASALDHEDATAPVLGLHGGEVRTLPSKVQLKLSRGSLAGQVALEGLAGDASGVLVQLSGGPSAGSVVTGPDGAFSFTGLLNGFYVVTASRAGWHDAVITQAAQVKSNATTRLTLATLPGNPAVLRGHVEGENTSGGADALEGALVTLDGTGSSAVTNVTGDFTLQVPAGSYLVRVHHAGYADATQPALGVLGGEQRPLANAFHLSLVRGALAGTVKLPDTADASGTIVELTGTSVAAVTGQSGAFRFDNLLAGTYEVTARHDGYQRKVLGAAAAVTGSTVTSLALASLEKQGGAVSLPSATGARDVALTLNAPKADGYLASEDPDFANAALGDVDGGAAPHAFAGAGTAPFKLTDHDGAHTVYVRFFASGVPAPLASAQTVLDRVAPAQPAVQIDSGSAFSKAPGGLVTLTLSALDLPPAALPSAAVSGIGSMKLANDSASLAAAPNLPFTRSHTWTLDTPANQGLKTVCALFVDYAGNASAPACAQVIYDTLAPSAPSIAAAGPASSAAHLTSSPLVTLSLGATDTNAGTNGANLLVRLSNQQGFPGATYQPFQQQVSWLLAPGDGAKTVYAQFLDPAGNESLPVSDSITLDTAPPASPRLSITESDSRPSNGFTNQAAVTLNLQTAAEAGAADVFALFSEDPAFSGATPLRIASGAVAKQAFTLGGPGNRTVHAAYLDLAGNRSATVSASVVVDTAAPSSLPPTLSPSFATNSTAVTVTLPAAGQDEVQIAGAGVNLAVTPAPFVAAPAGAQLPFTLVAGAEGSRSIAVTYRDLADNTAGPINLSILYDTTPPATLPFNVSGALADGTSSPSTTATTAVTLDLSKQGDALSGLVAMKISNTAGLADANWQPFVPSAKLPWALAPGDGLKTVYVALRDGAGNESVASPSTGVITLDTAPPTGASLSLASQSLLSQPGWSNAVAVDATVNIAGGAASVQLSESAGFGALQTVPLSGQALPYKFPVTLGGTGPRTLYARFLDAAGNASATVGASIVVDTAPPAALAPALSPSGFAPNASVQLIPPIAGQDFVSLTGGVLSPTGFVPAPAGVAIPVTLTPGDGAKSITVAWRDSAGNTTTLPAPLSITLEATPPVATNFNVWGSAADGSLHLGTTVAQSVLLDLHAEVDPISGTPLARIGALSDVSDGAWVAYTPTSTFTISSGDGSKTLYAQFQNGVGKLSNVVSGTVTLGTTATVTGSASFEGAGADLSGSTVSVLGTGLSATTAAGGTYSLASIPYGARTLVFSRTGFDTQQFQLSLSPGQALGFFAVALAASRGSVTGSVTPTGAADRSGTVVTISGGPDTASTVTDSTGSFRIDRLRAGSGYAAVFSRAAYASAASAGFAVTAGATFAVPAATLSLSTAGSLTGNATVARGTAGGVLVSLTGVDVNGGAVNKNTTSDGAGAWSIGSLPNGTYSLTYTKTKYDPQTAAGLVTTGGAVTAAAVSLAVSAGTIAGSVALTNGGVTGFSVGSDFSGAVVKLTGTDLPVAAVVTDSSGNYQFTGVPVSLAGAQFTVTASKPYFVSASTSVAGVANGTASVSTTLSLALSAGTLGGTALLFDNVANAGNNATSAGTTITVAGTAFNGSAYATTAASGASGAWTTAALPPGTYLAVAASNSRTCAAYPNTTVPAGATVSAGSILCTDAIAPGPVSLGAPAVPAGAQAGYTSLSSVTVPITAATDTTSPSTNLRGYQTTTGDAPNWAGAPITAAPAPSLTYPVLAANSRTVLWARAVDWVGNAGPASSVTVTTDSLPPPTPGINTPRSILPATTTSVTLSGSETDPNFFGYQTCSTTAATSSCPDSAGCAFAVSPASFALSLAANQTTCLYARAIDKAGNTSGTAVSAVTSDLSSPTAPSFTPNYDPYRLTVRSPYVDFFLSAASTDAPGPGGAWQGISWIEVDTGAGFQPLCPKSSCSASGTWNPCTCGCGDTRLRCDGATFTGVRATLAEGTSTTVAFRAVDQAGNVGPGVSQQVFAQTTQQLVNSSDYFEVFTNGFQSLLGYEGTAGGGYLLDLGSNRRLDASDTHCLVSDPVFSPNRAPVPLSSTLVASSQVNRVLLRRPGPDGLWCTSDDVSTVYKAPAAGAVMKLVGGSGERLLWVEQVGGISTSTLYLGEPGPDGALGTADDVRLELGHGDYVAWMKMGGNTVIAQYQCGACNGSTFNLYNADASGSFSAGYTSSTIDGPNSAGLPVVGLAADGKSLGWGAGNALVRREAGPDGRLGTADDTVVLQPLPWAIGSYASTVLDGQRMVVLTYGLAINWLVQWTPGPDGVWGTADDTVDRTHPISAELSSPSLSGGLLSFVQSKDVVVLDLSTLRWETSPGPSGAALSTAVSPLWADQGTVFYQTGSVRNGDTIQLVARTADGRETSVAAGQGSQEAWGSGVGASGGQVVALSPDKSKVLLYRPDSSGRYFTAAAPAPVALLSTTGTVEHVSLASGKLLTMERDASFLAHFKIFDGGAAGLASAPAPVDAYPNFPATPVEAYLTATQALIPCPGGVCIYGAGPDGIFGTADDTGGGATKELLRHGTGAAGGLAGQVIPTNYSTLYFKVDGRLMLYVDSKGGLSLLDAGPDGRFNTADDREQQLLTSWPTLLQGNFAVAGGRIGYITAGVAGGAQVVLKDGFDGAPYQLTEHYSIKRALALDQSGTAIWADSIFAPEGIMRRAP